MKFAAPLALVLALASPTLAQTVRIGASLVADVTALTNVNGEPMFGTWR